MEPADFSFSSDQRLKHRKLFDGLFQSGKRKLKHPLLMMYKEVELPNDEPVQVGFAVPKKHYKTAVVRNQVKRYQREVYRHQNHSLRTTLQSKGKQLAILFITLKHDNISYDLIQDKMMLLLRALEQEIQDVD